MEKKDDGEKKPFERLKDLTRRIVAVPKSATGKKRRAKGKRAPQY